MKRLVSVFPIFLLISLSVISPISTPSTFAEEEETCLVDGIRKNQTEDIEADYLFTKDGLQLNAQFTSEESEEHEDEEEEEKGIWKAYIQGKEVGAFSNVGPALTLVIVQKLFRDLPLTKPHQEDILVSLEYQHPTADPEHVHFDGENSYSVACFTIPADPDYQSPKISVKQMVKNENVYLIPTLHSVQNLKTVKGTWNVYMGEKPDEEKQFLEHEVIEKTSDSFKLGSIDEFKPGQKLTVVFEGRADQVRISPTLTISFNPKKQEEHKKTVSIAAEKPRYHEKDKVTLTAKLDKVNGKTVKQASGTWTVTAGKKTLKQPSSNNQQMSQTYLKSEIGSDPTMLSLHFKGTATDSDNQKIDVEGKTNVTVDFDRNQPQPVTIQANPPTYNDQKDEVTVSARLSKVKDQEITHADGTWTVTANGKTLQTLKEKSKELNVTYKKSDIETNSTTLTLHFQGTANDQMVEGKTTISIDFGKHQDKEHPNDGKTNSENGDGNHSNDEDPRSTHTIKLSSTLKDTDKVEIEATLEKVKEAKGTWTITFHTHQPKKYENKDPHITDQFDISQISETEVPVTISFNGTTKENEKIVAEGTEIISIKEETEKPDPKDQKTIDFEETIMNSLAIQSNHQTGGKLPKTATPYGYRLWMGWILFAIGLLLFLVSRNRVRSSIRNK